MLPLMKLGTLAMKTLSKPIAAKLKSQAGKHPKFRNFIISVAQVNHRMTTTMQRRIYGHATDVEIRPLNEEKAVQAAVDLIGEGFVFLVHSSLRYKEILDQKQKRRKFIKQEMEGMRQRDEDIAREVELLKQKLAEIEQIARGRGLAGVFNFKQAQAEEAKPTPVA